MNLDAMVEQLRRHGDNAVADAIEALRAENARLLAQKSEAKGYEVDFLKPRYLRK